MAWAYDRTSLQIFTSLHPRFLMPIAASKHVHQSFTILPLVPECRLRLFQRSAAQLTSNSQIALPLTLRVAAGSPPNSPGAKNGSGGPVAQLQYSKVVPLQRALTQVEDMMLHSSGGKMLLSTLLSGRLSRASWCLKIPFGPKHLRVPSLPWMTSTLQAVA